VVTGGSGGIGAATCRLFAANGAKVAVNGRDPARIDAVVDAIRAGGGQAVGVAGDCTDLAAVQRLRRKVEQQLGLPSIVLPNGYRRYRRSALDRWLAKHRGWPG
jgi:3-oxoacyl-[acyl-carrier protein] reductase